MRLRISILFTIFLFALNGYTQSIPKFESVIHNFGNISEDKGKVICEFLFTNQGPANLEIDTILTECRCATTKWSSNPIEKDSLGSIKVEFDPSDLTGNFQKEINVKFKEISKISRLRIIGNIVPGIGDPEKYYKKKIGGTRFRSNYLNMGKVFNDSSISKSFGVYNSSDTIITFFEQIGHSAHMDISIDPLSLKPGETGQINIKYDAKKLGKLGYQSDMITIASDEPNRNAMKYLNISANVLYAFPEMTDEERKNAANIRFEKKEHRFGDIIQGEIVKTSFKFTNTGKEALEILQTSVSCGCTAGKPDKEIYQAGESGEIKISFDSKGRGGPQNKFITVYTNAPLNPIIELRITAEVKNDVPEKE